MPYTNDTRDERGKSINDYKADYTVALLAGDAAGMAAANAGANAIRIANGGEAQDASDAIAAAARGDTSWSRNNMDKWDQGNYRPTVQQPVVQQPEIDSLRQQLLNQQNSYAQALAEQQRAQQAAVDRAVNGLEAQKTSTNDAYNQYFRQAYIDKMNAQKNLDQRLAAQGITGGAAESTLLGLNTAYSDALRSMEQGRIRDLEGLDRAITDARLTGDIESANAAANTIREQTNSYSDTLRYLLDQEEARNARQTAYDREDAAITRTWAQQLAMNALSNGYMPDSETLAAADMSTDYATSLLDAINRQREQQTTGSRRTTSGTPSGTPELAGSDIYKRLSDAGALDYGTAYDMLRNSGYSVTDANRYANYFAESYLPSLTQAAVPTKPSGGTGNYDVVLADVQALRGNGATALQINTVISSALMQGLISQQQAQELRGAYVGSGR